MRSRSLGARRQGQLYELMTSVLLLIGWLSSSHSGPGERQLLPGVADMGEREACPPEREAVLAFLGTLVVGGGHHELAWITTPPHQ